MSDIKLEPWDDIEAKARSTEAALHEWAQSRARLHVEALLQEHGYTRDDLKSRTIPECVKELGQVRDVPTHLVEHVVKAIIHRNKVQHRGQSVRPEWIIGDVLAMREYCRQVDGASVSPSEGRGVDHAPEPSARIPMPVDLRSPHRHVAQEPPPSSTGTPTVSGSVEEGPSPNKGGLLDDFLAVVGLILFGIVSVVAIMMVFSREQRSAPPQPGRGDTRAPSIQGPVEQVRQPTVPPEGRANPVPQVRTRVAQPTSGTTSAEDREHGGQPRVPGPCRTPHRGDELDAVTDILDDIDNRSIAAGLRSENDCSHQMDGEAPGAVDRSPGAKRKK